MQLLLPLLSLGLIDRLEPLTSSKGRCMVLGPNWPRCSAGRFEEAVKSHLVSGARHISTSSNEARPRGCLPALFRQ